MIGRAVRLLGTHQVVIVHGAQRFWEYNTCNNCEECRVPDEKVENQVARELLEADMV